MQTVHSARLVSSRSNNSSSSSSRPQPMPRRQGAAARARPLLHKRLKPAQPGGDGRDGTVTAGLRQRAGTVRSRGRLRARTKRSA